MLKTFLSCNPKIKLASFCFIPSIFFLFAIFGQFLDDFHSSYLAAIWVRYLDGSLRAILVQLPLKSLTWWWPAVARGGGGLAVCLGWRRRHHGVGFGLDLILDPTVAIICLNHKHGTRASASQAHGPQRRHVRASPSSRHSCLRLERQQATTRGAAQSATLVQIL